MMSTKGVVDHPQHNTRSLNYIYKHTHTHTHTHNSTQALYQTIYDDLITSHLSTWWLLGR